MWLRSLQVCINKIFHASCWQECKLNQKRQREKKKTLNKYLHKNKTLYSICMLTAPCGHFRCKLTTLEPDMANDLLLGHPLCTIYKLKLFLSCEAKPCTFFLKHLLLGHYIFTVLSYLLIDHSLWIVIKYKISLED